MNTQVHYEKENYDSFRFLSQLENSDAKMDRSRSNFGELLFQFKKIKKDTNIE